MSVDRITHKDVERTCARYNAAQALAEKYGWSGLWAAGGMPDETGNCYVCLSDCIPDHTTGTRSFACGSAAIMVSGKEKIERLNFARKLGRQMHRDATAANPYKVGSSSWHAWNRDFVVQMHEIISCEPAE